MAVAARRNSLGDVGCLRYDFADSPGNFLGLNSLDFIVDNLLDLVVNGLLHFIVDSVSLVNENFSRNLLGDDSGDIFVDGLLNGIIDGLFHIFDDLSRDFLRNDLRYLFDDGLLNIVVHNLLNLVIDLSWLSHNFDSGNLVDNSSRDFNSGDDWYFVIDRVDDVFDLFVRNINNIAIAGRVASNAIDTVNCWV